MRHTNCTRQCRRAELGLFCAVWLRYKSTSLSPRWRVHHLFSIQAYLFYLTSRRYRWFTTCLKLHSLQQWKSLQTFAIFFTRINLKVCVSKKDFGASPTALEKSVCFTDLVAWKKGATAGDQHQLSLVLAGCLGQHRKWETAVLGEKGAPQRGSEHSCRESLTTDTEGGREEKPTKQNIPLKLFGPGYLTVTLRKKFPVELGHFCHKQTYSLVT